MLQTHFSPSQVPNSRWGGGVSHISPSTSPTPLPWQWECLLLACLLAIKSQDPGFSVLYCPRTGHVAEGKVTPKSTAEPWGRTPAHPPDALQVGCLPCLLRGQGPGVSSPGQHHPAHTCCTCSRRAAGWPGSQRSRSAGGSFAPALCCSPAPPGASRAGGGVEESRHIERHGLEGRHQTGGGGGRCLGKGLGKGLPPHLLGAAASQMTTECGMRWVRRR